MGIPNLSEADEGGPHAVYHILNMSTIFRRVKIKRQQQQQQQQKTNTFFPLHSVGIMTATLRIVLSPKVIHKHHLQSRSNYTNLFCNVHVMH